MIISMIEYLNHERQLAKRPKNDGYWLHLHITILLSYIISLHIQYIFFAFSILYFCTLILVSNSYSICNMVFVAAGSVISWGDVPEGLIKFLSMYLSSESIEHWRRCSLPSYCPPFALTGLPCPAISDPL